MALTKKKNTKNTREKKAVPKKDMRDRYPMTIPQELYDAWQLLRRVGDGGAIAKKKGNPCRPIVDRALNYGHVKDENVKKIINKFFKDRVGKEKDEAKELIALALDKDN